MRKKAPTQDQLNLLLNLFNKRDFIQVLAEARPLLKQNKKSIALNKIVGAAEAEIGRFDNALIYFRRMSQIDPRSAESLFLIGNVMVAKQRLDSAIEHYRLALNIKPDYFAAAYNLGCQLLEIRRPNDAIEPLRKALDAEPYNVNAKLNLGIALFRSGELKEAEALLLAVTFAEPGLFEAKLNLGLIRLELGQFESAIDTFYSAEKIKPRNSQTSYGLGVSYRRLGDLTKAQKYFRAAIYHRKEFKEAQVQLASLELELGHFAEALSLYEQLSSKEPENWFLQLQLAEACKHLKLFARAIKLLQGIPEGKLEKCAEKRLLGDIYFEIYQDEKAIQCYEDVLQENQSDPDVLYSLALVFSRVGRQSDAIFALETAVKINPKFDTALALLYHQKRVICDWNISDTDKKKVKNLGMGEYLISPFLALAIEDHPMNQKVRSTLYAKRFVTERPKLGQDLKPIGSGRLRIGYFSGDIYDHPLLDLFQGVLREHDKAKFDISIYSYGPVKTGRSRELAQKTADQFYDAFSWSNPEFLDNIKNNPLDVVVDLSGYTEFARTDILATRVAPVQIAHLGYPSTTGAEFIDYLIADKTLIPKESRECYSEKIIFMPETFQANDNQRTFVSLPTTRFQNGLPEDGIVFCCFHKSYKISEEAFNIWLRILSKTPKSVLWFGHLGKAAINNLKNKAKEHDVDPKRLVFAPKQPKGQHLERLRHADLFLDTFNVNAGATASDALWSGVPVLTKIGQQFAARMAASLNKAADLEALVTETDIAYEDLAIKLAHNKTYLKDLKNHLLDNKSTLPLFDTVSYTRQFEAGLLAAYNQSRLNQSLKDIYL